MKIAAISAPSGVDFGLNAAFKIICDTLKELGENVHIVNLALSRLPHFDGGNATMAHDVMSGLRDADAFVFAAPAVFSAPCAMMHGFLEYFEHEDFRGMLDGKNCMLLAISQNGGERRALEVMATSVATLGASDVVNVALNVSFASVVKKQVIELIERQTEDFYRIIRQNRQYIPATAVPSPHVHLDAPPPPVAPTKPPINIEDLYKKHSLNDITAQAQDDIDKISSIFAQKYVTNENTISQDVIVPIAPASAGAKTCKQLTTALPHYFNPQLAQDVDAVIQLDITGNDAFSGYFTIRGQQCEYAEGNAEKHDILVISDEAAWNDILRKRVTAQKAFMMGQLKVRGNFVLLTKFDQLFNKIP